VAQTQGGFVPQGGTAQPRKVLSRVVRPLSGRVSLDAFHPAGLIPHGGTSQAAPLTGSEAKNGKQDPFAASLANRELRAFPETSLGKCCWRKARIGGRGNLKSTIFVDLNAPRT
jgi:hypothetical protein